MERQVTSLETGLQNLFYNLAFEKYVLAHRITGNHLLLWQSDNTVVIDQNQNEEEEINRFFVEEYGIHIVCRTTGDSVMYHDLGDLTYSFITDVEDAKKLMMKRFRGRL